MEDTKAICTAEMLRAGWAVFNQCKNIARLKAIGPGPGLAEAYEAMQAVAPKVALPADVRRLVIAARLATDVGLHTEEDRELFEAVEAFSDRVPYDDGPEVEGESL